MVLLITEIATNQRHAICAPCMDRDSTNIARRITHMTSRSSYDTTPNQKKRMSGPWDDNFGRGASLKGLPRPSPRVSSQHTCSPSAHIGKDLVVPFDGTSTRATGRLLDHGQMQNSPFEGDNKSWKVQTRTPKWQRLEPVDPDDLSDALSTPLHDRSDNIRQG
jgi:hypothetical protein